MNELLKKVLLEREMKYEKEKKEEDEMLKLARENADIVFDNVLIDLAKEYGDGGLKNEVLKTGELHTNKMAINYAVTDKVVDRINFKSNIEIKFLSNEEQAIKYATPVDLTYLLDKLKKYNIIFEQTYESSNRYGNSKLCDINTKIISFEEIMKAASKETNEPLFNIKVIEAFKEAKARSEKLKEERVLELHTKLYESTKEVLKIIYNEIFESYIFDKENYTDKSFIDLTKAIYSTSNLESYEGHYLTSLELEYLEKLYNIRIYYVYDEENNMVPFDFNLLIKALNEDGFDVEDNSEYEGLNIIVDKNDFEKLINEVKEENKSLKRELL